MQREWQELRLQQNPISSDIYSFPPANWHSIYFDEKEGALKITKPYTHKVHNQLQYSFEVYWIGKSQLVIKSIFLCGFEVNFLLNQYLMFFVIAFIE